MCRIIQRLYEADGKEREKVLNCFYGNVPHYKRCTLYFRTGCLKSVLRVCVLGAADWKVLKMKNKRMVITIAAATSVCGTSAAIATAAACKAKKTDLTFAVGMSLIFTVAMMVGIPFFCEWCMQRNVLGMTELIGGSWIGGTVDSTGAVVLAASLIFSFVIQPVFGAETCADIQGCFKQLQTWCFALAFTSIGLETNFKEMSSQMAGGKPLALYVIGQTFNLILTYFIFK